MLRHAVLIVVHTTKPPRDGENHGIHGSKLQDVIGQWAHATIVILAADPTMDGRTSVSTARGSGERRRQPRRRYVTDTSSRRLPSTRR